jgi:hypothetical protein
MKYVEMIVNAFIFRIMQLDLLTKADLVPLEEQLKEIKNLLTENPRLKKKWIKSIEAKSILQCSHGTLQNLRITGALNPTKIGGNWYYDVDEINALLSNNKSFS